MKIAHLSDLHIGRQLNDCTLLEQQRLLAEQIYTLLVDKEVDALVIAGDLFDRSVPSAEAVELLDAMICHIVGDLKIPVLAVCGNHDSGRRLSFASRLYRSGGFYLAARYTGRIDCVTLFDSYGPVDFYLLPYLQPSDVKPYAADEEITTYNQAYQWVLRDTVPSAQMRRVLVAHGFFADLSARGTAELLTSDSEVSVGGVDLTDAGLFKGFDYVALGHLHTPQPVGKSGAIWYSGSPLKYSLSEAQQNKEMIIVTLNAQGLDGLEHCPLTPARDLRIIQGSFYDLIDPAFHQNKHFDDYVFANIEEDHYILYAAEKLRVLFPNLLGLKFMRAQQGDVPAVSASEQLEKESLPSLFARFYREVSGEELNETQKDLIEQTARSLSDMLYQGGEDL